MRCPNCGIDVPGNAKFCPRCGYSFETGAMMPPPGYAHQGRSGSNTGLIIAIVIVAIVVIPIVLSAALYILVQGFEGEPRMSPAATYSKSAITGGWKISVVSITILDVRWDEVAIQVTDGTYFAEWDPYSSDLDGGTTVTASYGVQYLGSLAVDMEVTDLAGNGYVSGADYFTLTADFSSGTTYSVWLMYEPTAEIIGTGVSFMG